MSPSSFLTFVELVAKRSTNHVVLMLLVLFFSVGLGSPISEARDYYVSQGGNDSQVGTKKQPWRSIERVNRINLQPGDRVLLKGGHTFHGTIRLNADDSGNNEKKITVGSYGQGRAIIDAVHSTGLLGVQCLHWKIEKLIFRGSGRLNGNHGDGICLEDCTHVDIIDVEVSGFRKSGISVDGVQHVKIVNAHAHDNGYAGISCGSSRISTDLYVGYCTADNNPGDPKNKQNHSGNGIVIGHAKDVLVEYCSAHNNGWDMPRQGNGPVGIWTWNSDHVVIQHCISHDNKSPGADGGGFDLDGGTTNSVLQYNLSYNNDGPGYFLCQYALAPPLKNNVIRYNISQNDGRKTNHKTSIEIYAANSNAEGCQIYNNTIFNEFGAAVGFGGTPIPGVVFRNNLFITGRVPIVGDTSSARFAGNLWWNKEQDFSLGTYRSFQEWTEATGQEKIAGELIGFYANPKLFRTGHAKCKNPTQLKDLFAYRLQADSPCFRAGKWIPENGGSDFWGDTVSAKTQTSIGACQQASVPLP